MGALTRTQVKVGFALVVSPDLDMHQLLHLRHAVESELTPVCRWVRSVDATFQKLEEHATGQTPKAREAKKNMNLQASQSTASLPFHLA